MQEHVLILWQVVVGGGPTGIELSGELRDFLEVRLPSLSLMSCRLTVYLLYQHQGGSQVMVPRTRLTDPHHTGRGSSQCPSFIQQRTDCLY